MVIMANSVVQFLCVPSSMNVPMCLSELSPQSKMHILQVMEEECDRTRYDILEIFWFGLPIWSYRCLLIICNTS